MILEVVENKIKILTITLLLFPQDTGFGHFIFISSSNPRSCGKSPENQLIKQFWPNYLQFISRN